MREEEDFSDPSLTCRQFASDCTSIPDFTVCGCASCSSYTENLGKSPQCSYTAISSVHVRTDDRNLPVPWAFKDPWLRHGKPSLSHLLFPLFTPLKLPTLPRHCSNANCIPHCVNVSWTQVWPQVPRRSQVTKDRGASAHRPPAICPALHLG